MFHSPITVAVRTGDRVLDIAITSTLVSAGVSIVDEPSAATHYFVNSVHSLRGTASHGLIVVEAQPLAAFVARMAVRAGMVAAAVSRDCVDSLPAVLEPIRDGYMLVSRAVNEAANLLPTLSQRQHMILATLANSTAKDVPMSRQLGVSVATLKRDIAATCRVLQARDRRELREMATHLGYRSKVSLNDWALLHT